MGLHTTNASKHTFVKKARNLFSEFPGKECQVQSVKGVGTWSRSLIGKRQKPLIIFGEFNIEQVIEFARASRQHKKAQKVSDGPGPDKAKRKRGRPKKALSIKETSLPLDRTFNSFWKIFSPFLKDFLNFLSPKITIKAIFLGFILIYRKVY